MSENRPTVKFPTRPVDPTTATAAPAKSEAEVKAMLANLGYTLPAGSAAGANRTDGVVAPVVPVPQVRTAPVSTKQGRVILSAVAATVVLTGGFLFQTLVVASGTSIFTVTATREISKILPSPARVT